MKLKAKFTKENAKQALVALKDKVVVPMTKKRLVAVALVACFAAIGVQIDETTATMLIEVATSLI